MSGSTYPLGGADLEALEAYLMSDRSPPDCMQLSDLDGFLTAIAIGPEPIPPGEWLPLVWGGEAPGLAVDNEAQTALDCIVMHYDAISSEVRDGTYEPVLWLAPDGAEIAADWAEGFMLAVGLRPEAWKPLYLSRRGGVMMMPILALCGDEDGNSALGLDPELEDELAEQAPELLIDCVAEIAAFWQRRRDRQTRASHSASGRRAVAAKPGRNDPCPCGSGRKYKKCCGASA